METKVLRILFSLIIGLMLIWVAALMKTTVPVVYAAAPDGASGPWADFVVDYHQGLAGDGSPVVAARSNPSEALGPAETYGNQWGLISGTCFSLGLGGWIILGFDNCIINGLGNDIELWEETPESYGAICTETVEVWVSQDLMSWVNLGTYAQDAQVPLPSDLAWVRYVKLVDNTTCANGTSIDDGYDVDGVRAIYSSDVCPGPSGSYDWQKTIVERGKTYSYTSLAIGYDGKVHIAYGGEQLYYTLWDGYTWQEQEVESGGVGEYCSLALDNTGKPAISYYDAINGDLKYAHWNGTSWDIRTVDSVGDVGQYTSLAFDKSGNPAISYYDVTNDDLKYAHWNGTGWDKETVDSAGWVGSYTSLDFDKSGNPGISYYDATNGDLKYAYWTCCEWKIETVDSDGDVGQYTSLAFDSSGSPAISYHDATNGELKYAHRIGMVWGIDRVDSAGWVGLYTCLAFDSSGTPAISYYDATNGDLKYARLSGDNWDVETVDSIGDVGTYTSLAFDSSGNPAISYYDASNDYLKYAHWNGTSWEIETLYSVSGVGLYTSLAFDSSDNPAISYYDLRHSALKYAYWKGTDWDIEIVDSAGDVGRYTSLAFDSSGNPAISYYDATNGDLKYAYWKGFTWHIETVDSDGDVGSYTSLAFDSTGNPGISYYDATNGDLKYAHWDGTSWEIETVDSAGDVGRYTSLAFDSTDNPSISYYDATYTALKYAQREGAIWYTERVDLLGNVGLYTSLALDGSGNPAISYYDATKGDLKYAHWDGTSWEVETVDSKDWVGLYTSLAFDSAGRPAISYHDATNGDLKYAHWNGESWDIERVDSAGWAGRYTSLAFDNSGGTAISYDEATHDDLKYAYFPDRAPDQPDNVSPADGAIDVSPTPTLESSAFSDPDGDLQAASQWQVTTTAGDYSSPVYDSGTDSSNLTQIVIPAGELDYNTTYYWRVRYQDEHGTWSSYSVETSFTTYSAPDQPSNVSPADGAIDVSLTPTLESSAFFDPDTRAVHTASQWQVTTTAGDYSSPVFDSGDTLDLTQIVIPAGELDYNTTYYWRVRHENNHGGWSDYSSETSFTTYSPPVQPISVSPANGATDVSTTFTLQSSAFSDPNEGATHAASQWQVATDSQFSNVVYDSGRDISNLTQITITSPNHNTTYYWRVRHQDSYGAWSDWSAEASFTTGGSSGLFSSSMVWIFVVLIVLAAGAAIVSWLFLSQNSRKKPAKKAANRPKSPYH